MRRSGFVLSAILGFCCLTHAALADTFNRLIVFGDSMSDNGNLYEVMRHQIPASPPYYQGRFSNGPVWVERLAAALYPSDPAGHLMDYAYGGAVVLEEEDTGALNTLRREITMYLDANGQQADADSLHIVWIGGNNYIARPENELEAVADVVQGTVNGIRRLVDAGARHFLVVNLPNLGKAPLGKMTDSEAQFDRLTIAHNAALRMAVGMLRAEFPHVQWLFFDAGQMQADILAAPEQYGFTNVTETCVDLAPGNPDSERDVLGIAAHAKRKLRTDWCDGHLFFDPVHPTAPTHQIMADQVARMLVLQRFLPDNLWPFPRKSPE